MTKTTDFTEVEKIRLFRGVLESTFEIISGHVQEGKELWRWAKPYLRRIAPNSWYGNLYTKAIEAARCVGDSYAKTLEEEYLQWKKKTGIYKSL